MSSHLRWVLPARKVEVAVVVLHPSAPQLADLDLLLSVGRLGSLGKAAREHGMSQPAGSVRIQGMERRLGQRLLERSPSGSQFTPAGFALAEWAQLAIDAVAQLMTCSAALIDNAADRLRVSASQTMVECLIPRWVIDLRSKAPDLTVVVHAGGTRTVLADARAGRVDLGFVGDVGHLDDLHRRVVGRDELVVVVSPDHPWATRSVPVSGTELLAGPLVLREKGFGSRSHLQQALGHGWSERTTALELPTTAAVKEAAEVGAWAGVLGRLTVARELDEGRLVHVPVAQLRVGRTLNAVWDSRSALSEPARALLELASADPEAPRNRQLAVCGPVRRLPMAPRSGRIASAS